MSPSRAGLGQCLAEVRDAQVGACLTVPPVEMAVLARSLALANAITAISTCPAAARHVAHRTSEVLLWVRKCPGLG